MQPKKQLKVQYIGIFEEIDSFSSSNIYYEMVYIEIFGEYMEEWNLGTGWMGLIWPLSMAYLRKVLHYQSGTRWRPANPLPGTFL